VSTASGPPLSLSGGRLYARSNKEITMKATRSLTLLAALACLAILAPTPVRSADDPEVPSFKTTKDKDTKEFATKVGSTIIHAARSKPIDIELKKYEIKSPKTGRKEMHIQMTYTGTVSKKLKKDPFNAKMVVKIDSSDADKWEVIDIDYEDDNKSLGKLSPKPNATKINALKKKFNR
jgi:hypothetical protein